MNNYDRGIPKQGGEIQNVVVAICQNPDGTFAMVSQVSMENTIALLSQMWLRATTDACNRKPSPIVRPIVVPRGIG